MKTKILTVALFFGCAINAQDTLKYRPEIKIQEWYNEEPLNLDGKILVIEFWATWCSPCIDAIPHINRLSKSFSNDNVVFLSINSYDNKERIKEFIIENKFESFVVSDEDKQTLHNLSVNLIPRTVLIDESGVLRWKGTPDQLSEQMLLEFIHNDTIIIKKEPLHYSYSISHSYNDSASSISYYTGKVNGFVVKNKSISAIINQILGVSGRKRNEFRLINEPPITNVDFTYLADSTIFISDLNILVFKNLQLTFNFTIDTVIETQEIIELNIIDYEKLEKYIVSDSVQFYKKIEDSLIILNGIYIKQYSGYLATSLDKPVYIKDSNGEKYNINYLRDRDKNIRNLRNKYGIEIKYITKQIIA